MTRLERINFIRTHSPAHRNTNFNDYDDDDVRRLYNSIPLPPELEKQRDMEHGLLDYWFKKGTEKIFSVNMPGWVFVPTYVTWIILFNPVSVICECLALIIWVCYIFIK